MVNDYLIIGAGISGLTLAIELLRKGKKVRVLEASDNVGGLSKSYVHKGFIIDNGPHLFHSAHPEIIDYWRDFVGEDLVEKDFFGGNYIQGKIYDYPINMETIKDQYSNTEFKIIKNELSKQDRKVLSAATNYYDYVRGLSGDLLAEKFFTKYPKKLWGIDTKNLSARFAPRRIEIRKKRLPFHSGPGRFAGIIEGGCGVLAEKMKDEISRMDGEINLNSQVDKVKIDDKNNIIALIDTKNNKFDTSDSCIVSTIPINTISNLLGYKTDLYFRNIILVNIIVKGEDPFPEDYDWLYFDDENIPFHRAGIQTRFSKKGIDKDIHIICCEIAVDQDEDYDIDLLEKNSIKSLNSMELIREETVFDVKTYNIGPVYPGYYLGHEHELNRVNALIGKHRNIYLTGSLADYSYSDQQVLTAKSIDLARELVTLSMESKSEIVKPKALSKPSSSFKFGRNKITNDNKQLPFTIAEIGLCHNGDVDLCKKLILKSKECGFSSAKIQTYLPGRISKKSRTSRYFEETLGQEESISDIIDKIIFTESQLKEIFEYADSIDYDLFSTPFDFESAELLNSLEVPGFKISSMDLVNLPLIQKVASYGKPIILSTGMADIGEIEEAIKTVLSEGNNLLSVLHCVSSYPCPIEASNLERIKLIEKTFNVIPGFSDHTIEPYTPSFAMCLGARVIEKHVTLDKGLDGPDHNFSLIPEEMMIMMDLIRSLNSAINGNGFDASDVELAAKSNLRRSIYAKGDINIGDLVTMGNVSIKSPGDGIPVKYLHLILGKRVIREIEDDFPLEWEDFFNG